MLCIMLYGCLIHPFTTNRKHDNRCNLLQRKATLYPMPRASAKGESYTSPSWPSPILRQGTRHLLARTSVLVCLLTEADLTSYSCLFRKLDRLSSRELCLNGKFGTCLTEAFSIFNIENATKNTLAERGGCSIRCKRREVQKTQLLPVALLVRLPATHVHLCSLLS
jgi:hypothetical protein